MLQVFFAALFRRENKKDISALIADIRQTMPISDSDDIFASKIYEDDIFVNNESLGGTDSVSNRPLPALALLSAMISATSARHSRLLVCW